MSVVASPEALFQSEVTFGPLIGSTDVRASALAQLQDAVQGVAVYLRVLELRHGWDPLFLGEPSSFRAGFDWETYASDTLPLLIVSSAPASPPARFGDGQYAQDFRLEVAAVISGDDELEAILVADEYGVAVCGSILQRGSLGGISTKTNLAAFPTSEFVAPQGPRSIARCVSSFDVLVKPVLTENRQPPEIQPPYTLVKDVSVTLEAVPAGDVPAPSAESSQR